GTTYARLLVHAELERGYSLWFPEPSIRLPLTYLHESIRIGDVGFVTSYGNSDVLFNMCLPEKQSTSLALRCFVERLNMGHQARQTIKTYKSLTSYNHTRSNVR
ncbi:hypothetical protein EDC04DRAFT_2566625, partial [Pisolithus marmoratus]